MRLSKRPRGRPVGSGHKKPEHKATVPAVITPNLWTLVQVERRDGESLSDTIMRLILEKTYRIADMQKKVDALTRRLQNEAHYNTINPFIKT